MPILLPPQHRPAPIQKTRQIKIELSEIKYEVKFDTWLRGKVVNRDIKNRITDAESLNIAYNDDRAEDWLVRQIQDAVDNIYGTLRWCLFEDDEQYTTDEIVENPTEWVFNFSFSPAWQGSVRAMRSSIRTYICESVLYNWFVNASPDDAVPHAAAMENALTTLYENARSEKVYLEPFNL